MVRILRLSSVAAAAFALFTGCAGQNLSSSSAVVPSGMRAATSNSADMIYVSAGDRIKVYTYPGVDEVGQITALHDPLGVCSDTTGNVFATDGKAQAIFEFAHGGLKQIAKLKDSGWVPQGCSVDPLTGDLAVANYCQSANGECSGAGNIAVYKSARGKPQLFTLNGVLNNASFCGYDNASNLFVVGINGSSATSLAELATNSNTLDEVTLNENLGLPGNVQWDGTYVTVGDATSGVIHRFTITNHQATEAGVITFQNIKYLGQSWIQGTKVFIPNAGQKASGNIVEAAYPQGGPTYHIIRKIGRPFGVTYSMAP